MKWFPSILALALLLVLSGRSAWASIIRVPGDYASITEAAARAEPGAIIIVEPGSYKENVLINKPLFLRTSRGADKTTITAENPDKAAIHVLGTQDVTILGFTIKGSLISGILVEKNKNVKIILNKVINNENGLIVISSDRGAIISNNFDSNNSYGLYITKSKEFIVRHNSISNNGDKGLFVYNAHKNSLLDNKINLNRWNGMLIWSSNHNIIKNNRTLRNTFGIVVDESTDNDIANNTSIPDLFLVLPVLLVYLGFIFYLIQMFLFKSFSRRQQ